MIGFLHLRKTMIFFFLSLENQCFFNIIQAMVFQPQSDFLHIGKIFLTTESQVIF